jgi:hypothetical protein
VSHTIACTPAAEVASPVNVIAWLPWAFISATMSRAAAASKSAPATRAPSRTMSRAVARPAPVTSATLP